MLIKLLTSAGQRPVKAERIEAHRAETTPSGGWVITAGLQYKFLVNFPAAGPSWY